MSPRTRRRIGRSSGGKSTSTGPRRSWTACAGPAHRSKPGSISCTPRARSKRATTPKKVAAAVVLPPAANRASYPSPSLGASAASEPGRPSSRMAGERREVPILIMSCRAALALAGPAPTLDQQPGLRGGDERRALLSWQSAVDQSQRREGVDLSGGHPRAAPRGVDREVAAYVGERDGRLRRRPENMGVVAVG